MTITSTARADSAGVAPSVDLRVARLADAAQSRLIDPDRDLPGRLGDGQLIPDELLSVAGLELPLTAEQRRALSRAELASMLDMGIRLEAILIAGFASLLAHSPDLTDPRVRFLLHEIGEETRHQRVFARLLEQLSDTGVGTKGVGGRRRGAHRDGSGDERRGLRARALRLLLAPLHSRIQSAILGRPALFHVLVLAGEEIPDLVQKRCIEHPDTDDFLRAVNRYHRAEEARHIGYARAVFPEVWAATTASDRFATRHLAPRIIGGLFAFFIRPDVYPAAGLPAWETWRAVNASRPRQQLRHDATRPILELLLASGALRRGRIPARWQELCGVDAHGRPLATGTVQA